jgi:hypothetical protein
MSEYNPLQPFRSDEADMTGERYFNNYPARPPITHVTHLPTGSSGERPLMTTNGRHRAVPKRPVSGPLDDATSTPSLISALQSTMSPPARSRVVIPGGRRRTQTTADDLKAIRGLSPRLRYAIIVGVIVLVLIITLLSLAPLNSGQNRVPFFGDVAQWVHIQEQNWSIVGSNDGSNQAQTSSASAPAPPTLDLPQSQYVALARQDAIAAGINPDYFVRQIYVESGFNPNAVSPSGAVGIAQFVPSTAAGLGINPYDPASALKGAAQYMASYVHQYGGDYAKALAAYNAGSATVSYAVSAGGANWMNYLPAETRAYIHNIMGI